MIFLLESNINLKIKISFKKDIYMLALAFNYNYYVESLF